MKKMMGNSSTFFHLKKMGGLELDLADLR